MTSNDGYNDTANFLEKIRAELNKKEDADKRQQEAIIKARMAAMLAPGRAALKKKREDREKRAALKQKDRAEADGREG